MNPREIIYKATKMRGVVHTTLNPAGPGNVRIHMIPPKFSTKATPFVVILNGQDIIPINLSWAILLAEFMNEVNHYDGKEILEDDMRRIARRTIDNVKKVYRKVPEKELQKDLKRIISALCDIAYGNEPKEQIGYMTIGEYEPFMTAPHRIDLMVSSMVKSGQWNCNQKCLHCYACGQKQAQVQELSTEDWKTIIDKCRKARIPQLTFTGGEPTMRSDLVELIHYSRWFVTRLNTNGVLLTESLCKKLYDASLDSVQVTLYSYRETTHNTLVGANNFNATVKGIKNAIESGLNVSINTPLCTTNKNYVKTLKFIKSLGVNYVSCSGLIVAGNATKEESKATQLSEDELHNILINACKYCEENHIQISFTSPGWVVEEKLRALNLMVPSCGACLSNMAISPNGKVIPCQSWLNGEILGDMRLDDWKKIWNNPKCVQKRKYSAKMDQKCPLMEMNSRR